MRNRGIAQGAALSLLSVKLKPFAVQERTIRIQADQCLPIPQSNGPETTASTR
jgi:hypothetical protein